MFDLLGLIAGIFAAKEIIEEKTTKPYPKITDWDGYWKLSGALPRKEFEKLVYLGYFSTDKCVKDSDGNNVIEDKKTYDFDKLTFNDKYVNKWINEGKYNFNTNWYNTYAENYNLNYIEQYISYDSEYRIREWKQPKCNIKSEEEVKQFELEHNIVHNED